MVKKATPKSTEPVESSIPIETAESVEPKTPIEAAPAAEPTVPATKTIAKKKKKAKKNVPFGLVHILATFNNTIVSITDQNGALLSAASAGGCGFRGSKKGTAYAAQIAAEKAIAAAKQLNGFSKADVCVKGIGLGREAAIRAVASANIVIESIKDVTSVAHGGCRPKKARRV